MKRLGVIGGLGPMATAYFLQMLVQMNDADTDQEHFEVLLHSKPQIPDRTGFILGKSREDPLPAITEVGRGLIRQGAELIAIPCVTAHFFQQQLEEQLEVPVLNAPEETALYLKRCGVTKAGILATDGTIESGMFQETLGRYDIRSCIPDPPEQKLVMLLVYEQVKAGKPMDLSFFERASRSLFLRGAEVVLLACTELSLIRRDHTIGAGFLDVMEVLAQKAVRSCGSLRKEYEHLISK